MKRSILGLDLGTNSIGWGLINLDEANQESEGTILGTGVRIFQETTEGVKKELKNRTRREKRGMRRTISRRTRRYKHLQSILRKAGVFPDDERKVEEIMTMGELGCNPYLFRKKGLDEKLELHEFGRAMCHLNQRRGFQSNRKDGSKSKEDTEYKQKMAELGQAIEGSSNRTLGEYLANLDPSESKRKKHTTRDMYKEEFDKLWDKQAEYYQDILTSELKVRCHKAIFHQRPFRVPDRHIGMCSLEPTRKRAMKASVLAQRVRIWQEINNLRRIDPLTYEEIELTMDQKNALFSLMDIKKEIKFDDIRKKLGLHENEHFNLETENRKKLKGNTTYNAIKAALDKQKPKKNKWKDLTADQRLQLAEDLITCAFDQEQGLLNRLQKFWGYDKDTAVKLAEISFDEGYANLSAKAMRKILPFLQDGSMYRQACEKAGYFNSEQPISNHSLEELLRDLRNPVVVKALRQTMKVVRAITRMHGRPDEIVIEMARDLKLSGKKKEEADKRRFSNERENERVRAILETEFGMKPSRNDIIKYRLWEESEHVCPYTGVVIEREQLYSGEVDIEHIIPYSRSLDDSYMNKTLCMAEENRLVKRNRTPWEAYGNDSDRWQAMLQAIRKFPYPKRMNFTRRQLDDDFVSRQLNDTRYICTAVKSVFVAMGYKVRVSKGQLTALLRNKWDLEHILGTKADGKKSRDDHRHHAIDAIVTACVSQGMLQKVSRASSKLHPGEQLRDRVFKPVEPWTGFKMDVERAITGIVVSHQPMRGIRGALHQDTAYGLREGDPDATKREFVHRVPVESLTAAQVKKIIDPEVQKLVIAYRNNIDEAKQQYDRVKKGYDQDLKDFWKTRLDDTQKQLVHKDGSTPIKTVRIADNMSISTMMYVNDASNKPYKYYAQGSNHHVEIIRNKISGKYEGRFVTMMEAARRVRRENLPIVQYDHGEEWEFVMWLSINDMVKYNSGDNKQGIYRVQYIDPVNNVLCFRLHSAATIGNSDERLFASIGKVKTPLFQKLHVDPIGNAREYIDAKNP